MVSKTILIADDDVKLAEALTVRLESEGFTVISTQDAYQAVAIARRERPDLLLLDINMPAGSGFSVQQRVAEIDELADTPIVYITGEGSDSVDRTARDLGAFAVIHKPFETEQLLDTIRGALGFWVHGV
jgi:DNA-binding response OmpR family regulator